MAVFKSDSSVCVFFVNARVVKAVRVKYLSTVIDSAKTESDKCFAIRHDKNL